MPEDADFDPSKLPATAGLVVPQLVSHPPPGVEAHLQALDHAFGRAPLSLLGSLSGEAVGSLPPPQPCLWELPPALLCAPPVRLALLFTPQEVSFRLY